MSSAGINFLEKYAVEGQHYDRNKRYQETIDNPNSDVDDLLYVAKSGYATEQHHEGLINHAKLSGDGYGARMVAVYSKHKNILNRLSDHDDYEVKAGVARNANTPEDTLLKMATRHEPQMNDFIKSDLLNNSKLTQKIVHAGMEHSLKDFDGNSARISQFAYFSQHHMADQEHVKKVFHSMPIAQKRILQDWHSSVYNKLTKL